jgi:hypothetical protein
VFPKSELDVIVVIENKWITIFRLELWPGHTNGEEFLVSNVKKTKIVYLIIIDYFCQLFTFTLFTKLKKVTKLCYKTSAD